MGFDGETATVTIVKTFPQDAGKWSCSAVVDKARISTECQLVVKVANDRPCVVHELNDKSVMDGEMVELKCEFRAVPIGKVSWTKDGKSIPTSAENFRQSFDGHTARLIIDDVFCDDAGVYTCVLRSASGQIHTKCKLDVLPSRNIVPRLQHLSSETSSLIKKFNGMENLLDIDLIRDIEQLQKLLATADTVEDRKRIRNRIRDLKDEKMHLARSDPVSTQRPVLTHSESAESYDSGMVCETSYIHEKRTQAAEENKAISDIISNMGSDVSKDTLVKDDGHTKVVTCTKTKQDGGIVVTRETQKSDAQYVDIKQSVSDAASERPSCHENSPDLDMGKLVDKTEKVLERAIKSLPSNSKDTTSGRVSMKSEYYCSETGEITRSSRDATWGKRQIGTPSRSGEPPKSRINQKPRSVSNVKDMILKWCQEVTKGYSNVNITNFSGSWADGMAFCALIHRFYPDAFDYSELKPQNRRQNFTLAFHTAETRADIAPLLEVGDMLLMGSKPDWRCVFTYVQSFYRRFRNDPMSFSECVKRVDNVQPERNDRNNNSSKTNTACVPNEDTVLKWCQRITKDYPNVNVSDFSNSWSDGLAFCSLVHHFYPDSMNFNDLTHTDKRNNLSTAFSLAKKHAAIFPTVEVDEFLTKGDTIDSSRIFHYVLEFYRKFHC